jgi:hypothetical protein
MTKNKFESQIEYLIECLPEDIQIEGNAMASGDADDDKRVEDSIREQLNNGNEWAWCTVKVTAFIPGTGIEGTDYLGCCSYKSESDFKRDGYYKDMCAQAKADLLKRVKNIASVICPDNCA